jgi:two-component system, NtrC family, sensor kinase
VKLRTKLILTLSSALVVTVAASTWLRIRWTKNQLEEQLKRSAQVTAQVVAEDLTRRLTPDLDGDEIGEEVTRARLRHPNIEDIALTFDTDEDTTATISLAPNQDAVSVVQRPSAARRRPQQVRRDESRRALLDRGDFGRRPGMRLSEPLWRTGDRPQPDRWPAAAASSPAKVARTIRDGTRGKHPVYEVDVPIDPDGPRKGHLNVSFSREQINNIVRTEQISSILITGTALLLLMLITALIVNRVVARPVVNLERAMKQVEGGALGARVEAGRQDEFGTLSRGFNDMLERLAQADSDIRAFNRRLADEVQAATTDLARKNAALAQLNRLLFEARRELGDKERLAALGQLAAQLAHEIGTPLGSVSGHLQLALIAAGLPASVDERLRVASKELERVSKIVRDYLDSTRRVAPEKSRVDVRRVVDEAVGLVHGDERRAEITVERKLDPSAVELSTDPGLLRQILVNLLNNAADAVLQRDGAGSIELSTQLADGNVVLSVRDDGVGIAPDDVARIFEPFYTTKGRGKGTGLGLAICRELAVALGGRISVESEPGRGSTFTLTLPRGDVAEAKAS